MNIEQIKSDFAGHIRKLREILEFMGNLTGNNGVHKHQSSVLALLEGSAKYYQEIHGDFGDESVIGIEAKAMAEKFQKAAEIFKE